MTRSGLHFSARISVHEPERLDSTRQESSSGATDLSSPTFPPDHVVGGRYRVIEIIGKGGMGIVYKVEQVFLGKKFALKTIDRRHISDATTRRFQHEARATFAVDHPNIVSVHDYGLLDDQTPFLAMELVTGQTLSSQLAVRSLSVEEAIPIFTQVCFGLAHAHKSGVVHRDIKPSNIMIIDGAVPGTEGSVKILDFGIAKFTHHEDGEIQALTKTGEIFGSPLYMSPEQCMGMKVDHRSDVYSLGCVLYEALTGTPPYAGENALATMMMHTSEPLLSLKEASLGRDFPAEIEKIVQTMLAKKPEDRYQSLGVAANDLAAVARGAMDDVSVLNPSQSVDGKNNSDKMVTVSQSQLIFQMIAISLLSALVSAVITHFVQGNPSQDAESDAAANSAPPHKEELPQSSIANLSERDTKLVGKQPPYSHLSSWLKTDPAGDREYATVAQTLNEAITQIRKGRVDVKLQGGTVNKAVLDYLAKQKQIEKLDFLSARVSNPDLGALASLPKLNRISFLNATLDDVGIRQLARCEKLETLKIGRTFFTNAGMSALSKFKHLLSVNLENSRQVTVDSVNLLCRSNSICRVNLSECPKITAADRNLLRAKFKHVVFKFNEEKGETN
jgi:serine/threonine protein kinase